MWAHHYRLNSWHQSVTAGTYMLVKRRFHLLSFHSFTSFHRFNLHIIYLRRQYSIEFDQDSKSSQLCSLIPFQLWPNWKLFRWFQNFRIDSKMIQTFQRLFSDFLQTAKFEIIQQFVFQIQSNSKKFRKIPIVSGYSKRFEVYSRKFQRVRRVFIRVIYVSYIYDMLHYEMHMIYIIQVGYWGAIFWSSTCSVWSQIEY